MNKTYIFCFFLLLLPLLSQAQDSTNYYPNYLYSRLNGLFIDNQNTKISPAVYYGLGGGIDIGYLREGYKFRQEICLGNNGALATNPNSLLNSNQQIVYYGHLDYSLLKKTNIHFMGNKILFGVAWHLQAYSFYNSNLSNSAVNYDLFSGLDFMWQNKADFHLLKWQYIWQQTISTGLFSYYLKDAYNYPAPDGYISVSGSLFRKGIKSLHPKSLLGLQRLTIKESLLHNLHNGNRWAFAYEWNYYKLSSEFPRLAAFHTLSFALYFNL